MYGIMTKISSVSSQNQLLMLNNAPEFTSHDRRNLYQFITKCREIFFCPYIVCKITRRCIDKKKFSTFSYKLVQISTIMILVNSGAFLSISSWFCELTELIFVMIPYISSTG